LHWWVGCVIILVEVERMKNYKIVIDVSGELLTTKVNTEVEVLGEVAITILNNVEEIRMISVDDIKGSRLYMHVVMGSLDQEDLIEFLGDVLASIKMKMF